MPVDREEEEEQSAEDKQLGRYVVSSGNITPVPPAASMTTSPSHMAKHWPPSSTLSPSKSSVDEQGSTWQLSTGFSVDQQPAKPSSDKPSSQKRLLHSPSSTNPPHKHQPKHAQDKRQFQRQLIKCNYKSNGCRWTGEMEKYSEHISMCQYNPASESSMHIMSVPPSFAVDSPTLKIC